MELYELNDSDIFEKLVNSHAINEWHELNKGEWIMITTDNEDDLFIISITDKINGEFIIISPNAYYSLTTHLLDNINAIVSKFCNS